MAARLMMRACQVQVSCTCPYTATPEPPRRRVVAERSRRIMPRNQAGDMLLTTDCTGPAYPPRPQVVHGTHYLHGFKVVDHTVLRWQNCGLNSQPARQPAAVIGGTAWSDKGWADHGCSSVSRRRAVHVLWACVGFPRQAVGRTAKRRSLRPANGVAHWRTETG
ncbi:predicted protein [Plenodomus lingam JN3]|uniref:Predicted protein n=1 Tax=Leptosphaeria maculans (strain JN3 / isolate v23.1.3 / race Av1-4-5-6-7-8) TaxID=985895 RepID=E4ZNL9_LEPMJ|nr:predicted protein [Plenodomus lingam JN3]CBX93078.1 predicted protein [Plenodomus lingam JN3]